MCGSGGGYGLGIESLRTSLGVPSLLLMEKALFGARLCRSTDGSKFGCLLACLLKQKPTHQTQSPVLPTPQRAHLPQCPSTNVCSLQKINCLLGAGGGKSGKRGIAATCGLPPQERQARVKATERFANFKCFTSQFTVHHVTIKYIAQFALRRENPWRIFARICKQDMVDWASQLPTRSGKMKTDTSHASRSYANSSPTPLQICGRNAPDDQRFPNVTLG